MEKTIVLEGSDKIEINLRKKEGKGLTLSMSGECERNYGQCLSEIAEKYLSTESNFKKKEELETMLSIWKRYHLNDLRAGTPLQEEELKRAKLEGLDFSQKVAYLKSKNIYVDNGYKYGSSWLFEKIPTQIISTLIDIANNWD